MASLSFWHDLIGLRSFPRKIFNIEQPNQLQGNWWGPTNDIPWRESKRMVHRQSPLPQKRNQRIRANSNPWEVC